MSDSYEQILKRLLEQVDDTLDKRQGSIIFDALAPAAMELAQCYASLEIYKEQTYLKTATGENLDNRVADYAIYRNPATNAIRIITVVDTNNEPLDIELGSKFTIPVEYGGYNYIITERIEVGKFKARCETVGSIGNDYLGVLLPLYNINGLGKAEIVGTFQPGEDIETDEDLRKRAINAINKNAFGGNQADYRRYMQEIEGVGQVKIFPVWNGGGTVKLSFVNSDNSIPSDEFVDEVQTEIDPIVNSGEGIGLAPIGHHVTVTKPVKYKINIDVYVDVNANYSLSNVQDEIIKRINDYILEVQNSWQDSEILTIYLSKVIAYSLLVTGIDNVARVIINDEQADLQLEETAQLQQFPVIGEVNIYEN